MESSNHELTFLQKRMLEKIEQYDGLLWVEELAKMMDISKNTIYANIVVMEGQLGRIVTRKEGKKSGFISERSFLKKRK